MTRNELKQLIRQTLEESRVRSSPVGYNAAIRAAAEKFKEKEAEKAVAVEAEMIRGEELLQADEQTHTESVMTEISGDRIKPDLTEVIESEESKKKTYMTKNPLGQIQIKNRS